MSVIERAAKRLQELRSAGVGLPDAEIDARPPGQSAPLPGSKASTAKLATGLPSLVEDQARGKEAAHSESTSQTRISIDLSMLAQRGIVTPTEPRAIVSEEFRIVKRPLLRNASARTAGTIRNGNLIMVTSSLPGEGKTTTAISLAMSIALEMDKTVLLVDADVAKPSVMGMLGLQEKRGLLDVLANDSLDLSDVLLRTNVENLVLLPSGPTHARSTELLASDSMAHLLEEISGRYPDRIIVFDSPPLLLTNEARVLATHMGQILFVVEAGRTLHSSVTDALTTIEACPVKLFMLNKIRGKATGGYYGYSGREGVGHYGYDA